MCENICKLISSVNEYNGCDNKIDYKENEPLSGHCTFKIGGFARLFVIPKNTDALIFILNEAKKLSLRTYVIGNGSNILFSDAGFDGVIISTEGMNSIRVDGTKLYAECGAMLSSCGIRAKNESLTGMECLFGIPGTIGGAVFMNAGAYGGEIRDVVVKTTYLDPETMEIKTVEGEDHKFGYRHSLFKENGGIILSAELQLKEGNIKDITAAMEDYKKRRVDKQPLEFPSAGSTFKRYPGRYTGQMIDECGLKGYTVGGAQVSEKHAGFVINRDCASSEDVCELVEHIKHVIRDAYGIDIETEIIYVE